MGRYSWASKLFSLFQKAMAWRCLYQLGNIPTPAGYASTNNPLESYNATIKKFFTNRFKFNFLPCLSIFKEVLENMNHKQSNSFRRATYTLKERAKKLENF